MDVIDNRQYLAWFVYVSISYRHVVYLRMQFTTLSNKLALD